MALIRIVDKLKNSEILVIPTTKKKSVLLKENKIIKCYLLVESK
ncbi:hypothetical protein RU88_GL001457 [Lactococcus raffinolactis]|nr:hypothetical protein RU88_GL001457 [Lactococcus raffinolactis]